MAQNNYLLCSQILWIRNLGGTTQGCLISDPLGRQLKNPKVGVGWGGDWNLLRADSLLPQFSITNCLSGPLVSLCFFSSWYSLNARYGGCFKGGSLEGEGTRQELHPLQSSALEISSTHLPCSAPRPVTSPHPLSRGETDPPRPWVVRNPRSGQSVSPRSTRGAHPGGTLTGVSLESASVASGTLTVVPRGAPTMGRCCATHMPVHSPDISVTYVLFSFPFQRRKLRPIRIKPLALGCATSKWHSQHLSVALCPAGWLSEGWKEIIHVKPWKPRLARSQCSICSCYC